MAILSSDGTYVTVEKGDTLWGIAEKHLGSGSKYTQLAAISKNNIVNPNLIYTGQKIYLSSNGGSPTPTTSSSSNKVTIKQFGLLASDDNTLFVTWTWGKESQTESYKIIWTYTTIDGVEFINTSSNSVDKDVYAASRQATYSIPSGSVKVTVRVKPISKTEKDEKTGKETSHFTASWSDITSATTYSTSVVLDTPSIPSIEIEDLKLTATLENVTADVDAIEFQVYKNDSDKVSSGKASISATDFVSYSCNVAAGNSYKVRCRAVKGKLTSEWSNFSSSKETGPAASSGITKIEGKSETSVYLEWGASATAEEYEIEYTTEKDDFEASTQTPSRATSEVNHVLVKGLTSGEEYFFRVRAKKGSEYSPWTEIKSVLIGVKPGAPTTWSSSTTVITGEPLTLYWVHNSEDGSSQTLADLEMYVNGTKLVIPFIKNSEVEDEKDKTSFYIVDTSGYSEGTTIQWRVRTAGITEEFGEWSTQRTIDVYAPPTLELSVTDINGNLLDTITTFPFYIRALAGPNTQLPIGYHLSVISNDSYETLDNVGNPKTVNIGDEVYSKYFDISDHLVVEFSAGNIDLENSMSYVVKCIVAMNSGLTAEVSTEPFVVQWVDNTVEPNAQISIDPNTYTAYVKPYCEDRTVSMRKVSYSDGVYTLTDETVNEVFGEPVPDAVTTTGEKVYSGVDPNGNEFYYATVETATLITDVLLSVYRREFNGTFTEIAKNIDAAKNTTVTDPHPSLDYARYRIVATTKDTGAVSYYDLPGHPVGCKSVIIQWDEEWSNFDITSEDALANPPWAGSLLNLPYNIDVSDNSSPDVSLVKYIGREHPVSYYGTQLGQTATWNTAVIKSDVETLYALRRLARWMGDVYVREPSGSGYWAHIVVSFSQKHGPTDLTIPVTMNITRVEGGV